VGIVLLDVLTVTVRRVLRRRDPALPDRGHIHHLLLRRGYTVQQSLLSLVGANVLLGLIGIALWRLGAPDSVSLLGFLFVAAVYLALFLFPARLWRLLPRRLRAEAAAQATGSAGTEATADAEPPAGAA